MIFDLLTEPFKITLCLPIAPFKFRGKVFPEAGGVSPAPFHLFAASDPHSGKALLGGGLSQLLLLPEAPGEEISLFPGTKRETLRFLPGFFQRFDAGFLDALKAPARLL